MPHKQLQRGALGVKNLARTFSFLLSPRIPIRSSKIAAAIIPLLLLSASLVVLAAWAMPDDYSWRTFSISESAAQGQNHGWIARLAFLSFGTAAFLLALCMRERWSMATYWCQLIFFAAMVGAAAFSHSPWQPGVPNDQIEDLLHSISATTMGFAFSIGVSARFLQRGPNDFLGRSLDVIALLTAIILLLLLNSVYSIGGLAQRVMFAVAYIWFGYEALIALGKQSKPQA